MLFRSSVTEEKAATSIAATPKAIIPKTSAQRAGKHRSTKYHHVVTPVSPQVWLGSSVWRAGSCASAQNFQTFSFTQNPKVEVGSGKPGEGEQLAVLRVSRVEHELIQIETRVCAPVGCNQTVERYKIISSTQMQEWHFEGRLPNTPPYVLVANGQSADGTGAGRTFNRCAA